MCSYLISIDSPKDGAANDNLTKELNLPKTIELNKETDADATPEIVLTSKSRQRKRKVNRSNWKRELNKNKRMKGEEYSGFGGKICKQTRKKQFEVGIHRQAREIGPPCKSARCAKRKNYHCSKFTTDDRAQLFQYFWKSLDWPEKKTYVVSLIDKVPCKRRRIKGSTRRSDTNIFYLKLDDRKVQVCRYMFQSTLGVGRSMVANWTKPFTLGSKKIRKAVPPSQASVKAAEYLDMIPKLPSHYCRMWSSKLYLEPQINSKNDLYAIYKDYCKEHNFQFVSRFKLNQLLDEKNIAIFQPRKDQCDTCQSFKVKQVTEEVYNKHIKNKELAQQQKRVDKLNAIDNKCHAISMDMQAVKLSPMLQTSALYYKTKLMVHNFTIYDLRTKNVVCYWWNESEADLTASVFATCVTDYISTYLNDELPVIIYSDGCGYQNRNSMMSNALLDLSVRGSREIIQKYLEKGHTQMECDSVHSAIEAELKNKSIYVPNDYVKICEKARPKSPYIVKYLEHDFFKDYTKKETLRYISIRPGMKKGDPVVTDVKNYRYTPEGKMFFKLSYEDDEWREIPGRKQNNDVVFPNLFHERIKISSRKYKDLQELKSVIPAEHHSVYDNLPHAN